MRQEITNETRLVGLMKVPDFAKELGVNGTKIGVKPLYKDIEEGKLKAVRLGRLVYVLRSELRDYPERLANLQAQGQ